MAIRTYNKNQKIAYKYSKNAAFQAKFSGNISSAIFSGEDELNPFQTQLAAIQNLSSSLKELKDYSFYGCFNMVSANLGGVEIIGNHCFEKCQNLIEINLPRNCQKIGDYAFSISRSLQRINYLEYEQESSSDIIDAANLSSIGSSVYSQTPCLNQIIFPKSINNLTSQISVSALNNAALSSIIFLGQSSTELLAIQKHLATTQLFGLEKNCEIITSDGKKLKYTNIGGSLVIDETYSLYGKSRIQIGKINKLKLGRSIYWFTEELYQWCMDPTKQDPDKFPSASQCPFIVFYGDFLTSQKTKKFLSEILENKDFQEWRKEHLKCYLFLIDRKGNIENITIDQNLVFFRNLHSSHNQINDFVIIDFFYKNKHWSTTFNPGSFNEFKNIIESGMSECSFSDFDFIPYEYALDALDPETIPTTGADSAQLKSLCGSIPWWFKNGEIVERSIYKLSKDKFNFQVLSTPETTYLLVGAYDSNNPNHFPVEIQNSTAKMWKPYADNFKELYNKECTDGGFTALFEEGPKYRYFICFEFSHGAPKLITIDNKLTYSKIWSVVKDCRGKVFLMFDSCDSGSMFQTKTTPSEPNVEQNTLGITTYLVQHFQRRSHLLKTLFATSSEDIDPQIICWSSTTASTYGWYYPRTDTIWAEGLRKTDKECQGQRYLPTFLVNKEHGFYGSDCIPQRKSYQTKNGKQIIGECKWHDDNGIVIDAEKCIIWS